MCATKAQRTTMNYAEARTEIEKYFKHAPAEFSDGVRIIKIADVPANAEAMIEGAEMSVRIPAAHHKKPHQGWLVGYWNV
jgi:hypothetical protein